MPKILSVTMGVLNSGQRSLSTDMLARDVDPMNCKKCAAWNAKKGRCLAFSSGPGMCANPNYNKQGDKDV